MDATFGGGLVVLELALFLSQLEHGVVRDKGGEMVLGRDRWIHSEQKSENHWRAIISQERVVVESPCVVTGSDDPRSMMIPPKRRRVVSFHVVWIISFESNSEGYENPGFGCCSRYELHIFCFCSACVFVQRRVRCLHDGFLAILL